MLVTSTQQSTAPTPLMSVRVWDSLGVHLHQASSSGIRLSKTSRPSGLSDRLTTSNVIRQSSSVTKTWETFPVMVARSTWSRGRAVTSPWMKRTRSAPGFMRANSSDAAAGSSAKMSRPRWAGRQAGRQRCQFRNRYLELIGHGTRPLWPSNSRDLTGQGPMDRRSGPAGVFVVCIGHDQTLRSWQLQGVLRPLVRIDRVSRRMQSKEGTIRLPDTRPRRSLSQAPSLCRAAAPNRGGAPAPSCTS
jgi:hypothetical protein